MQLALELQQGYQDKGVGHLGLYHIYYLLTPRGWEGYHVQHSSTVPSTPSHNIYILDSSGFGVFFQSKDLFFFLLILEREEERGSE